MFSNSATMYKLAADLIEQAHRLRLKVLTVNSIVHSLKFTNPFATLSSVWYSKLKTIPL